MLKVMGIKSDFLIIIGLFSTALLNFSPIISASSKEVSGNRTINSSPP